MESEDDKVITLSQAAKTLNLSARLLRREAKKGKLKATLHISDLGVPVYKTTMRDVKEWRRALKMGRPRKNS